MKVTSKGNFTSIKQFSILEDYKLGNGSFGVVKLAIHNCTNKMYAIKIIKLDEIPSQVEMKLVQREIKLHSEINNPHTITLWDTLMDDKCIYMILEYAEQGNLFYYQNTKNVFSEAEAFKFFSQTAWAVSHLHKHGIMHRDIKPENLLLDEHFNIKLCDFGWAAQDIFAKRSTFCGTYEYMSPEMLFKMSYDYRVDIWALGVLLYELVHGCAPFKGDSVNQVKQKMLKGSYQMGEHLSASLKSLIANILKFDPAQRLTLQQIFHSEWVHSLQSLINFKMMELVPNYDPKEYHQQLSNINITESTLKEQKPKALSKNASEISITKNVSETRGPAPRSYELKNINVNFSINNFVPAKSTERGNYNSPSQYLSKKRKKETSRCRTQTQKYFDVMSVQSPSVRYIKNQNLSHLKDSKEDKKLIKPAKKSGHRARKSQDLSIEKQNQLKLGIDPIESSGRAHSKMSISLKKKSLKQKLSPPQTGSTKNLHNIKTKFKPSS